MRVVLQDAGGWGRRFGMAKKAKKNLWRIPVGFLALCCASLVAAAQAQTVKVLQDIAYKPVEGLDEKAAERWKLDVYLPAMGKDFPVVVWFHGGGLTSGDKYRSAAGVARHWAGNGVAVVSANYRFSPTVKFPAYLEDGAAAVAWAKANMSAFGADVGKLFVGGHSAGAYMALMIGLDERYLAGVGMQTKELTGLIPVSGQTMTHFTVREERGQEKNRVVVDEAAPVFHVRKDAPPMLLVLGDRDRPARWEENLYFAALCRAAGHERVFILQGSERDHGGIFRKMALPEDAGGKAVMRFIKTGGAGFQEEP